MLWAKRRRFVGRDGFRDAHDILDLTTIEGKVRELHEILFVDIDLAGARGFRHESFPDGFSSCHVEIGVLDTEVKATLESGIEVFDEICGEDQDAGVVLNLPEEY